MQLVAWLCAECEPVQLVAWLSGCVLDVDPQLRHRIRIQHCGPCAQWLDERGYLSEPHKCAACAAHSNAISELYVLHSNPISELHLLLSKW